MKNPKMMVKLLLGFGVVALIVLAVGYFGLSGAAELGDGISTIGVESMPSLENLMVIDKPKMTVDSSENALMVKEISETLQRNAYADFDSAKKGR